MAKCLLGFKKCAEGKTQKCCYDCKKFDHCVERCDNVPDLCKQYYEPENNLNGCQLFNCDKRRGNYCCALCAKKHHCRNHCRNNPELCGYNIEIRVKEFKSVVKEADEEIRKE